MRNDPIRVGMAASLTGQFRTQGKQALEGALAWVQDTNGEGGIHVASAGKRLGLRLAYHDDGSRTEAVRALTEKLIVEDGVDILLGPYSSVLTLAASAVAERYERVLWNHGGASDRIHSPGSRWTVGVLTPASRYLTGVMDLVREGDTRGRRVAILYSSRGTFPIAVASGLEAYARQQGSQVVFKRAYQVPVWDFSPLLEEVKEAAPDVVVGVGRLQDDLLLARQLAARPPEAEAVALVAAGVLQFGRELGADAHGFLGPSQWEPETASTPSYGPSVRELAERHPGFRPCGSDYPMAQAYAAGLVARKCVEDSGTLDNGSLREAALRQDFTTFYGRFRLDPYTGVQAGRPVLIVQWQRDRKMVVWPREMRQAAPLFPWRG